MGKEEAISKAFRWPWPDTRIAGERVYPPANWKRAKSWKKPSDCVKACAICKGPIWRNIDDEKNKWLARAVHKGECQYQYSAQKAAEKRKEQAKNPAVKRDIAKLNQTQHEIDDKCGMMYVKRMWLTPGHPVADYYFRGAVI